MLFVKTPLEQASATQSALIAAKLLDERIKVEKDAKHIFFPIKAIVAGYTIVEREGKAISKPKDLQTALASILSAEEREQLIAGHDIVGNIAIIDVPDELAPKQKQIVQAVLDAHKHVTTVLKKAHKHSGEFRTQSFTHVAGEDTREALVVESGCKLLVDVEQVYFSVRLSTERLRIARSIKPEENVLVMFSGAAPYPVILSRHSVAKTIVGVEKNPVGHRYALENVRLNKLNNVRVYEGDCADLTFLQEKEGLFDRIIMPLPASSEAFLPAALSVAKTHAIIHIYIFGREDEKIAIQKRLENTLKLNGWSCYVQEVVKAGHHAPFVYRWCFDLQVERGQ